MRRANRQLTRCLSASEAARLEPALPSFKDSERAARLAQAAADSTRIVLLAALRAGGELCVSDRAAVTGREQSVVSHHLGVLQRVGLVARRQQGTLAYYTLTPAGDDLLCALLAQRDQAASY